MAENAPIRYRFVGEAGSYIDGVPARDLRDVDLELLSAEQQQAIADSDLYEAGDAPAEEA